MESAHPERVTVPFLVSLKGKRPISALTAYDYSFARILDQAGVDVLLVGDSIGSVIQGGATTLPVTLDEMIYHSKCVVRGAPRALVVGDMPFLSYQVSKEAAVESAGRLIKEGGVGAVKLEGGTAVADAVAQICRYDIPVMAHIGLTPQSYHRMGGYKIQGRKSRGASAFDAGSRERILDDARAVQDAGAFAVVIEGVPAELANEITEMLHIPTIGIGAGAGCDGQILVCYDLLGITAGEPPRFVKRFAEVGDAISGAVKSYVDEVTKRKFPSEAQTFHTPKPSLKKTGTKN